MVSLRRCGAGEKTICAMPLRVKLMEISNAINALYQLEPRERFAQNRFWRQVGERVTWCENIDE
jgi:hypothetical protein